MPRISNVVISLIALLPLAVVSSAAVYGQAEETEQAAIVSNMIDPVMIDQEIPLPSDDEYYKVDNSIGEEALDKAKYFLLYDPDTNEILVERNSNVAVAPSSMTKLMTAYVVFSQIKQGLVSFNNQCFIGKDAWRKRGSTMFLGYGDIVSIEDLLRGLLVVSGNDAAIALAETTAGSYENFVNLMNAKAKEMGLTSSHFANPHGLNEVGHYMSLRDLATLTKRLLDDFPQYSNFLAIPEFHYRGFSKKNYHPLVKDHYEGVIGGKTGYTSQGGYGAVGIVQRGNRRLIAVVNKAVSSGQRASIIKALMNYGFEKFKKVTIFNKNQMLAKVPVVQGSLSKVEAIVANKVEFNIPATISSEDIKIRIEYESPLVAPITKDSVIGIAKVRIDDFKFLEYPLLAKSDVAKAKYGYVDKFVNFFTNDN